jgi:hypothetical protein
MPWAASPANRNPLPISRPLDHDRQFNAMSSVTEVALLTGGTADFLNTLT